MDIRGRQITLGNTALPTGKGLGNDSPLVASDPNAVISGGGSTFHTLPAIVPIVNGSSAPDAVSGSPSTVGPSAAQQTAASNNATWSQYLLDVISNPSQHVIAVIVLLLLAWWLYKHVLKKFL